MSAPISGSNTQSGAVRAYGGIGDKIFNFGVKDKSTGTSPWLIGGIAVAALAGVWMITRKK